jgi:hypothetical protein
VNPAAHDDAAGLDGGERQRDEVADRREDQCGVEGSGGDAVESPAHAAPSERAKPCAAASPAG